MFASRSLTEHVLRGVGGVWWTPCQAQSLSQFSVWFLPTPSRKVWHRPDGREGRKGPGRGPYAPPG
jgi:hypothetical protein